LLGVAAWSYADTSLVLIRDISGILAGDGALARFGHADTQTLPRQGVIVQKRPIQSAALAVAPYATPNAIRTDLAQTTYDILTDVKSILSWVDS